MIRPTIDLEQNKLILQYHGTQSSICMDINEHHVFLKGNHEANFRKICGKVMQLVDCESAVNEWLSEVIFATSLNNDLYQ